MHTLKIALIFFFFAFKALASFTDLPSSMSFDYFGYNQMTLGNLCYAIDDSNPTRPCHPARLADRHDFKSFGVNLEGGLGSERKSTAEKVLNSQITSELIGDLYSDNKPVLYSGGVEFFYQQPLWSFSISPFKTWYYSHSVNPAYPLVDLHILESKDIQFQLGSAINSQVLVGANIKFISRKFIHQSISIYDLLANESSLQSSEQNIMLFEPGLIWNPKTNSHFKSELTLMITNLGFQDKKFDGFSIDPTIHAGASIGTDKETVNFKIGAELDSQNPREPGLNNDLWRLGTVIGNDWLDFTYSGNRTEKSLGLLSKAKYFYSGLIYEVSPERINYSFNIEI